MSKRLTSTEPNPSKRLTYKPFGFNSTQSMGFNSRDTSRGKPNDTQPISHAAKRNAYDRIKKIETLEKEKGYLTYEQLMREVKIILKDDIEIPTLGIFPGDPKNETGRAILNDGTFFVAFSKIVFKCQYTMKKAYLQKIKERFLPKVNENKTILILFLEDEEEKTEKAEAERKKQWFEEEKEKIKEELKKELPPEEKHKIAEVIEKVEPPKVAEPLPVFEEDSRTFQDEATMTSSKKEELIRKPCIKPPSKQSERKSVRWSQILNSEDSTYLGDIVQANREYIIQEKKEDEKKEKNEKIAEIRKKQSFLLDFFEINDIYDLSMVDVVGIVDEIDDRYAVLLIKEKTQTPPPSFVKTRSSKMQENEYKKDERNRREFLAIGLLKNIDVRGHELNHLKDIQCKYPDIWAYVEIDDPDNLFLSSLPSDSDIESFKKEKKY